MERRPLAWTGGAISAMAWAMSHPAVTSVLIGARNPDQVDNALAAMEMGLDPELRAEMSSWTEE